MTFLKLSSIFSLIAIVITVYTTYERGRDGPPFVIKWHQQDDREGLDMTGKWGRDGMVSISLHISCL